MNKVKVLTDSTAYMPSSLIEEYEISVIPLTLIWGEETFRDGVDITPAEFYQRLQESETLPSTSQPSVAAFKSTFKSILEEGQDVLGILISSEISGTIESALQAKNELERDNIVIIDSRTSAMAMGLHVLAAARAAAQGADLQQCQQIAQQAQEHTDVVFAVDTLKYLHRGGRIGGAKRFLGSMLNIKPILEMQNGSIEALDQVRTQQHATQRLIQLIEERVGSDRPRRIAVIHSQAPARAQSLLDQASQVLATEEAYLAQLSPVIGTHVGPGTLALACMHGM